MMYGSTSDHVMNCYVNMVDGVEMDGMEHNNGREQNKWYAVQ